MSLAFTFTADARTCLRILQDVFHFRISSTEVPQLQLHDGRQLIMRSPVGSTHETTVRRLVRTADQKYDTTVEYSLSGLGEVRLEREYLSREKLKAAAATLENRFVCPLIEAPLLKEDLPEPEAAYGGEKNFNPVRDPGEGSDRVLIRREVHGTLLKNMLSAKIGFTPEQNKGMRELRAWAIKVSQTGILGWKAPDLNPSNVVWVNDPGELLNLGLDIHRPTFILKSFRPVGTFESKLYDGLN